MRRGKRIFQAGSQRVSSILYAKAGEIYASGRLGEVHSIDAQWNRNSPGGAWVYPIPPDASPETMDWKEFLRMRRRGRLIRSGSSAGGCFADYGSGLGGDLFVHLLSGIFSDYRDERGAEPGLLERRALPLQGWARVSGSAGDDLRLSGAEWEYPGASALQPEQQRPGRAVQLLRVEGNAGGDGQYGDVYAAGRDAAV